MSVLAVPAAAHPGRTVDGCENADEGPAGDAGPPGFVGVLVGGVCGARPVPNFVTGLFGAAQC